MNTVMTILTHPLQFAAGLFLLVAGVWLLRKAGVVMLAALSVGLVSVLTNYLETNQMMPVGLLASVGMHIVGLAIAFAVSRHPIVSRNAELLFTMTICFLAADHLAASLHWPVWTFAVIVITGTCLSPVVAVAGFATALLCLPLGIASGQASLLLFFATLAITRLQNGRWLRGYWDPNLNKAVSRAGTVGAAGAADTVQVVFSSLNAGAQKKVLRDLQTAGIKVEQFPGGAAGAEIPRSILRRWKHPWRGLFQFQPSNVYSGQTLVEIPPDLVSSSSSGIGIDRVAELLRSNDGRVLPPTAATGKGVTVAVLDTGINPVTPALKRSLKTRVSFVEGEENDVTDRRGHGTAVGECVVAVAPAVKLISVRVLGSRGQGTMISVLRGIQYVAENHREIDIANLSLGASCGADHRNPLARALSALADIGVASCSAAGNSGPGAGTIETPGISPGTLCVAAVDVDRHVARFSSRGPCKDRSLQKPDLANYGVDLRLPDQHGSYKTISGTSFASPLTAGVLAGCWKTSAGKNVRKSYDLLRNSCTPPASGSARPEATGSGVANLAVASGRATRTASRTAPTIRRRLLRTAAVVSSILILCATWWNAVDHVTHVVHSTDDSVQFVGRIRSVGRDLAFDDGTGTLRLEWVGPADSRPIPGSIVFLTGAVNHENLRIEGEYRLQIAVR